MSREQTHWPWLLVASVASVIAMVFVPMADATTITLNATHSGWYDQTGFNDSNPNYVAGVCCGNGEHRNFFVFDLSGLTGSILGATLRLFNPSDGYVSPAAMETYTLFNVVTPISTLTAGGSGLTQIFDDLGSGPTYGSRVVSVTDDNTVVEIALDATALTQIAAVLGGSFAIGGAITTLEGTAPFSSTAAEEVIFANSPFGNPPFISPDAGTRQLVLTLASAAIPEPSALTLACLGAAVLIVFSRRRR